MNRTPHFSIITVTYNSADWIAECLSGLQAQSDQDFELILIDNASKDGTVGTLKSLERPVFDLVLNDKNMGFAAACNQGAELANGEWLIFLNPDTVPDSDWLAEIKLGQNRHKSASAFACTQLDLDDPRKLDGAGDVYSVFGIAWRGGFGAAADKLPQEGQCFSACGAAMVIKRHVFENLSGFEERFFCYYEDIDLGFRARLMGEKCIYLPHARIKHEGGASSESDGESSSEFAVYHGVRNRFWTYIRNMPLHLLVITMPVHLVITAAQIFSARKTGHVRTTISGLCAAVKGSPEIWRTRKLRPTLPDGKPARLGGALTKSIPKLLNGATHIWPDGAPDSEPPFKYRSPPHMSN